jgi:hypothetical protein
MREGEIEGARARKWCVCVSSSDVCELVVCVLYLCVRCMRGDMCVAK